MAKREWTDEDIRFLRENFGKLTNSDIAERLDRKVIAIYSKARGLGLIEPKKKPKKSAKKIKLGGVDGETAATGRIYQELDALDDKAAQMQVIQYLIKRLQLPTVQKANAE